MKVLITGGTGTVGKSLVKQNNNEYISISRNEENIADLKREYPDVKCYVGNIEDKSLLLRVFKEVKPDVVVHSAAMKHIDLMEQNPIAGCNVKVIKMDYAPQSTKNAFYEMSQNRYESKDVYKFESNYVINSTGRLAFITNIISRVRGNSLVLFHRIEHGKRIYEKLRQDSDKPIYYVDGNTDKDIREEYKKKMEAGAQVVIVASYGTFSTGISINKIHNIFFTESFKSEVIIRQSIGRGLRKHHTKSEVNIIDFVDDLSSPDWDNYLIRHSKARQKIYKEQKFPFEVKNVQFDGDI